MSNTSFGEYNVIGLMSGTSLDGVDIAFCRFIYDNQHWKYSIEKGETIPYTKEWKQALLLLEKTDALSFQQTHIDYGTYLGNLVDDFIKKNNLSVDFVSSHGHTIFHQPQKKLTVQIGAGSAIAAACKLTVVCDFRSLDVALGGQGAPLVPVGDKLLFSEYDFCLNLGGFANVSYDLPSSPFGRFDSAHQKSAQGAAERIAFDICPVNIVMNAICASLGKEYDNEGELARNGMVHQELLDELNQISFYKIPFNSPKSLGKEWVIENIDPILKKYDPAPTDALSTFCEHVAMQIATALNDKAPGKIMITGGGAFNTFLLDRLKKQTKHELIVPEKKLIEFKEALLFAFLGVLRMRNEINCLKSVTGAKHDNVGGAVYIN